MQLSPHGKGRGPSFEGTWNPSTQGCFVPSLVEIGPLVLEKNMKMLKVTTLTPTDNRQILIRKAHSGELIKLIHNSYQFQQFWVIFFIIARLFIFLKFKRYHLTLVTCVIANWIKTYPWLHYQVCMTIGKVNGLKNNVYLYKGTNKMWKYSLKFYQNWFRNNGETTIYFLLEHSDQNYRIE